MNLVNFMEEAARRSLEEMLVEPVYKGVNLSEKEKLDILAIVLNRLPPKYLVTERGYLFTRLEELRQQFKTDLLVELARAIEHVRQNPRG
jgi:competence protein ComFB